MGSIRSDIQVTNVDLNPSTIQTGRVLVITTKVIEKNKIWADYSNKTWGSVSNLTW